MKYRPMNDRDLIGIGFLLTWEKLDKIEAKIDRILKLENKEALYLVTFVAATYALMCNIPYGMNLRYTNMWDMPLRFLAVGCLADFARPFGRRREMVLAIAVVLLCAIDLRQYYIFFVQHDLYEMVTAGLLRALLILK